MQTLGPCRTGPRSCGCWTCSSSPTLLRFTFWLLNTIGVVVSTCWLFCWLLASPAKLASTGSSTKTAVCILMIFPVDPSLIPKEEHKKQVTTSHEQVDTGRRPSSFISCHLVENNCSTFFFFLSLKFIKILNCALDQL